MPPISKSSEIEATHSDSETKVAPSSLVSTQMPQASKQIVFETKLQQKPEAIENKLPNTVEQKPTQVEEYKSKGTPANLPKPNESRPEDATIGTMSVIKNILSKTEEKSEEQGKNSSILKEDSEYWSAKEVNIESVIKTVDAMCTTDDEGNVDSKIDVKSEPPKSEIVDDVVEKDVAKVDATKTDAKVQPKREKGTRNKKAHSAELETQDSPPSVAAAPEIQSGIQTRRGVVKPPIQTKRLRNNRNVSPRSKGGATVLVGNENKPRNNNSESDIYEFHEDSGEESMAVQSNEGRKRALSISKPSHTSTQPSSPNAPQAETAKPQATVVSAPEPEIKPVQSPEVEKVEKIIEPQDDTKEDATGLNNVRKSRRLIERDGRSTVDDIIEDVVKNMSKEQSVITTSAAATAAAAAAASQQQQQQPSQTQPRRSTRNTTNQTAVKLTTNEKTELRKSPRPNRGAKDASATEEKNEESPQRSETQDGKRDNESDATQSASESGETARTEESPKSENAPIEEPKVQVVVKETKIVAKETPSTEVEKRKPTSREPMSQTLIDPVTGEMTVVQQSNEDQYVPVSGSHGAEYVAKPSVLVTSREVRPIIEPTTTSVVSKVSTTPVVTIVSKPAPTTVPLPVSVTVSAPVSAPVSIPVSIPAQVTAPVHVQKSTVVITSKAVEPPSQGVPLSMSIEKTLAQPAIHQHTHIQQPLPSQQQPSQQPQTMSHSQPHQQIQIQPHHQLKAHVLGSQHVKVSQAPVISSVCTPVILSTSVPSVSHITNLQPVIKSTSIIQSNIVQPNIQSHKYGKESATSVIAQQPQYQTKIQSSVAQQPQPQPQPISHLSAAHKNTLIVNIPTSSPANAPPSAHSPRRSPNIPPKVTHTQASLHESQYSIHVPKHSVANIHQSQMLAQKPVVIHSNTVHMPQVSTNYTSVVQSSSKVIQTPLPHQHHLPQPTPLVQMGPAQPIPLQHLSQVQPPKSSHQISIQSTQPAPFVSSIPLQVRTSSSISSPKFKPHILPPNIAQIQSQPPSIGQQQSVAKQSTFPPQSMPPSNQIRLQQASQIMTGAVASPPPKQPHLVSQQPIVAGMHSFFDAFNFDYFNNYLMKIVSFITGASSSRVSIPPLSPQGQQQGRPHSLQQPGLPVTGFEANLVSVCIFVGIRIASTTTNSFF